MPEFQADKRNYKEAARTNTESQQWSSLDKTLTLLYIYIYIYIQK